LYNFIPIGGDLVMAEVIVPELFAGKTLVEADLRQKFGVNVIAIRSENSTTYRNFDRDYRLASNDLLLVAGNEADVFAFSGIPLKPTNRQKTSSLSSLFKKPLRSGKAGGQ
jgi:trk system potassium uptake protein TrkA